ncbi:MAG: hypothetical protein NVSMB14_14830 [Isosphaeraceae bacterium]
MRDVVVDTCCLINLWAVRASLLPLPIEHPSKKSPSRATLVLDMTLHIVSNVQTEGLYVYKSDEEDSARLVKDPIVLSPYFQAGLLSSCDLNNDSEKADYVRFATQLDDGESAALAIAKHRGWTLATDDRPASRLASQFHVPVLSTPAILKDWACRSGASVEEIATVLSNIKKFANYIPNPKIAEVGWWNGFFDRK